LKAKYIHPQFPQKINEIIEGGKTVLSVVVFRGFKGIQTK
jgi:hypothetical protein